MPNKIPEGSKTNLEDQEGEKNYFNKPFPVKILSIGV